MNGCGRLFGYNRNSDNNNETAPVRSLRVRTVYRCDMTTTVNFCLNDFTLRRSSWLMNSLKLITIIMLTHFSYSPLFPSWRDAGRSVNLAQTSSHFGEMTLFRPFRSNTCIIEIINCSRHIKVEVIYVLRNMIIRGAGT